MRTLALILALGAATVGLSLASCTRTTSDYEIVAQKHFGASGASSITMCLVNTRDPKRLEDIGRTIAGESKLAFVYFYSDKTKVKDISRASYLSEAAPGDGFVARYTSDNGLEMNAKAYVVRPASGPVKIVPLEQKTKKAIYRWYTYYVENYTDTPDTDNKMIEIAKQLPFSDDGSTEVFFFNDKSNAPRLAEDGGWAPDESQNSWNAKYGKYCVGYYFVGGGVSGDFSKGWK